MASRFASGHGPVGRGDEKKDGGFAYSEKPYQTLAGRGARVTRYLVRIVSTFDDKVSRMGGRPNPLIENTAIAERALIHELESLDSRQGRAKRPIHVRGVYTARERLLGCLEAGGQSYLQLFTCTVDGDLICPGSVGDTGRAAMEYLLRQDNGDGADATSGV